MTQKRLLSILEPLTPGRDFISLEVAFRPVPEFDLRCADVAWVSPERWLTAREQDDILGAPDLVIEVRSPSNTVREISEKRMLCLTHGSQEFWLVDEENRRVDITRQSGETQAYRPGDTIPLALFGPDTAVQVDLIFPSES